MEEVAPSEDGTRPDQKEQENQENNFLPSCFSPSGLGGTRHKANQEGRNRGRQELDPEETGGKEERTERREFGVSFLGSTFPGSPFLPSLFPDFLILPSGLGGTRHKAQKIRKAGIEEGRRRNAESSLFVSSVLPSSVLPSCLPCFLTS
jgi:hypothetical protein